jgi:hypothetical protein
MKPKRAAFLIWFEDYDEALGMGLRWLVVRNLTSI